MAITRLSGGTTPPNGSDPRTFPSIWNDAVDDIEALELPITADRIADGAVTAPKLAKTAGAVMVFDDDAARTTAIPTPVEGMVTYLKDTNQVQAFTGSAFTAVGTILQVVTATNRTQFTTSANTFQATGLTATITPGSSSSKVFVIASNHIEHTSNATRVRATLFRGTTGGTNLGNGGNGMAQLFNLANGTTAPCSLSVLDSPSTTSAQAYNFAILSSDVGNAVRAQAGNAEATITLMEVAG